MHPALVFPVLKCKNTGRFRASCKIQTVDREPKTVHKPVTSNIYSSRSTVWILQEARKLACHVYVPVLKKSVLRRSFGVLQRTQWAKSPSLLRNTAYRPSFAYYNTDNCPVQLMLNSYILCKGVHAWEFPGNFPRFIRLIIVKTIMRMFYVFLQFHPHLHMLTWRLQLIGQAHIAKHH